MSMRVDVDELKSRFPEVVSRLRNEELIVLQDGNPIARLVPMDPVAPPGGFDRPAPGAAKGKFVCTTDLLEPMPEDELAQWYNTDDF